MVKVRKKGGNFQITWFLNNELQLLSSISVLAQATIRMKVIILP
jgi:hypothetical protein